MALRTIPVVLSYCEVLARVSPEAVLINFTNPAGIITQALSLYGGVRAVGVCDTPNGALERLGHFLDADPEDVSYEYSGLNHLGWISSFSVDGEERIDDLLRRYEELQRFDHRFRRFRRSPGPSGGGYPHGVPLLLLRRPPLCGGRGPAGTSRGQDVLRLNEELLGGIARAFDKGDVEDAWSTYSLLLGVAPRHLYAHRHRGRQPPAAGPFRPRRRRPGATGAAEMGVTKGWRLR